MTPHNKLRMTHRPFKIGIVAGERSGDALGAGLLRALYARAPDAQCSGLGGEAMLQENFHSIADMQRLSVMGILEPLKRLPDLFALRRALREHFIAQGVDIVVTIDSPDFNLGLARQLKARGIRCCHYVCPSVWAWRQGRVRKIAASIDHVLCLLPFEEKFLRQHGIAASFVGHPLADKLCPAPAQQASGGLSEQDGAFPTLCIMPGSRDSEVSALLEPFLQAALRCVATLPELHILIPAATPAIASRIQRELSRADYAVLLGKCELRESFLSGESQAAMREATVVLLASGTATLEAALMGLPMVVAYRMSALGFALASRLVKVKHVALPNLLLGERAVPELVQNEATPARLSEEVLGLLQDPAARQAIQRRFAKLGAELAKDADSRAAEQVLALASDG
ncbi:MAG: lipid-A-disaccharide synthase [Pseudomonadales bacterium]|nr:lipid-A-disaccharide synthase [Pseudomonadales bacterium]